MAENICPKGHVIPVGLDKCPYCETSAGKKKDKSRQRTVMEDGAENSGFTDNADIMSSLGKGETAFDPSSHQEAVSHSGKMETFFEPGGGSDEEEQEGGDKKKRKLTRPKLAGWMVSYSHDPAGEDYRIREGRNRIGRDDEQCEVVIRGDLKVSGVHAILMIRGDGRCRVKDNDSQNGTWVNDEEYWGESCDLHSGDTIKIGDTALRIFLIE